MRENVLFLLESTCLVLPETKPSTPVIPPLLKDHVNTDNIIPAAKCLFFDDIGRFALTGLPGIQEGQIASLLPTILISGDSFGCGSAREHAPISLKNAGIKLIIATSFDETFRQNCTNLGVFTSTNLDLAARFIKGEEVPKEEILTEFKGIEREILEHGGLFAYNRTRFESKVAPPEIETQPRAMTMTEKIIAQHLQTFYNRQVWVKPGDQSFVPLNIRMSYEVFTPLIQKLLQKNLADLPIIDPDSVQLIADHFVANFDDPNHPVHRLLTSQKQFAQIHRLHLYENQGCQAQGICHNLMIENHLLPGQLCAGTDSHSSMWGVLGCLGIPVGATAMANAFLTKDILFEVPETIKVGLKGKLKQHRSAKDVIFDLMNSLPSGEIKDKVIEFDVGNLDWSVDELSVLTCMAKELGALTAIIAPNEKIVDYLCQQRGLSKEQIRSMIVMPDQDAKYSPRKTNLVSFTV